MPNNTDGRTIPTIIRWTDDECCEIADHLCVKHGKVPMRELDLQKIRAKDVFVAQAVLPEDRHRKLVSIAQGIEGIRARLDALTQKLSDGKQASACAEETEIDLEREAASRTEATVSPIAGQDLAAGDRSIDDDGLAAEQPSEFIVFAEKQGGLSVRQTSSNDRPQERAPIPGLLEAMRPFIVMFCEEFAKAFMKVISTQGMNVTLPAASGQAQSRVIASCAEALHGAVVEEMEPDLASDKTNHEYRLAGDADEGIYLASREHGEEDAFDVQPLFDPKLPPSADSDFKPKIGLVVGTPGSDFEGLRQHYPQLHLTIVQAEALSDVRRFGHCQRIIALRDEISPGTDALLSRELRHRYIQLAGGIKGIKAQLDAWLASPGSIAAGSRRRLPFGGPKRNAAFKTKRESRYPKWAGDAG